MWPQGNGAVVKLRFPFRCEYLRRQALAVKILSEIEAALIAGDWSKVRTAALQLANLADNRDQREGKK